MKSAVLKRFLLLSIITLTVSVVTSLWLISAYTLKQTEHNMSEAIGLIDYSIDYEKNINEQLEKINPLILSDDSRITITDMEGNIVGDTDPNINYGENHLNRPEIQSAISSGTGLDARFSSTTDKKMLYAAAVCDDHVLRVAIPYNSKMTLVLWMMPAVVFSILLALAVSLLLSNRFSKTISRPLEEVAREIVKIQNGDYSAPLLTYSYDEINKISQAAHTLSQRIRHTMDQIVAERNKAKYVLNNMSEGLVLCDINGNVTSINKVANSILECESLPLGKHIVNYTRNVDIINGIADAYRTGKTVTFDYATNDSKVYSVVINKASEKTDISVIMVFIDVTNDRKTQNLRQEFFSNASHELKTPITSIQGYSELLSSGMDYPEEMKKSFVLRIKKEAQNMTTLINDILMISRLEAGTTAQGKSEFDLALMIEEIVTSAKPSIKEQNLNVEWYCPTMVVNAEYKSIYALFNNIIINAIKYNKENGSVEIRVARNENRVHIVVKDTGIGIPEQSKQRVFERFYRVDKGRSKKIGGTGLGLAIVKHIVSYYGGTIDLKSELGVGTEITIDINL